MKNTLKSLIFLTSLMSAVSFAGSNKAIIDIQIDNEFKNKNIIFIPETDSREELGIHHARGDLISHELVEPIITEKGDYPEVRIRAFVTDSTANMTRSFISHDHYQIKPDSHIAVSFPIMFENG
jgi:hypothetical protein